MKIYELFEDVTPAELYGVEQLADALWGQLGIDVTFTRHFMDRVNDPRNKKPIDKAELVALFKKEYEKYGKAIAELPNAEAVMKDEFSKINLPFAINNKRHGKELVAKTVMRKDNFMTPNTVYTV